MKRDITLVKNDENANALQRFIEGKRTEETRWCDWNIPLHWGGMSDPFQPKEETEKRSLACLKIFAKTGYPFIVSTKSSLVVKEPYLSLLKQCNCVIQFSAACEEYNKFEEGATPFKERVRAAETLAKYKRVNIRVQPYIPSYHQQIYRNIELFSRIGIYGLIFESIKYKKKVSDMLIKVGGDYTYPSRLLISRYTQLRDEAHRVGLHFYCGENRLRNMGDNLCCCGVEGLGWNVNHANLNHFLFDKHNYRFTEAMKQKTGCVFKALMQTTVGSAVISNNSFESLMRSRERYASSILTPFDLKQSQ